MSDGQDMMFELIREHASKVMTAVPWAQALGLERAPVLARAPVRAPVAA